MTSNYSTPEAFIHKGLCDRAERLVVTVRDTWRKTQRLTPHAITWPGRSIKTDNGVDFDGAVLCQLPQQQTQEARLELLRRMVARTEACGLVLIDRHNETLRVLFETRHGARAWLLPLERHGDVIVCKTPVVRDNAECVGLLWHPPLLN